MIRTLFEIIMIACLVCALLSVKWSHSFKTEACKFSAEMLLRNKSYFAEVSMRERIQIENL